MKREEAIRWLTNEKWTNANNKYKKEWNEAFDLAIEALSATNLKEEFESAECEDYEHATLVDIKEPLKVSVVRCKDCRHGQYDATHYFCAEHYHKVYEDDYCSYGERRSNRREEVNGFKSVGQSWNTSQGRWEP